MALAEAAAAALGMDYAGVDLVPDAAAASGAQVIEVNGVAAWRGLQRVTAFDIAQALVDDLLATGGTLAAAAELIRKVGGQVPAAACIVELTFLNGRDKLDMPVTTLAQYDK